MIPEKAGGNPTAKQSIEIWFGSDPIPHKYAAATIIAGVKKSRKNVFQRASLSIENLTVDNANPAASTATPELALAIKSNVGAHEFGIWIPINTKITAINGAAATGCLIALMTESHTEGVLSFSSSLVYSYSARIKSISRLAPFSRNAFASASVIGTSSGMDLTSTSRANSGFLILSGWSSWVVVFFDFDFATFARILAWPWLISASPIGIVMALTTIETIPMTRFVETLFP